MTLAEKDVLVRRLRRSTSTYRQEIIARADEIQTLKDRGCARESLRVEHNVIEQLLHSLRDAIITGASRDVCIEILNASIDFCASHFANEEEFMQDSGSHQFDAHIAAHKRLLARFVEVRRSASGEGLPLAALDAADLLEYFHEHVERYDQVAEIGRSLTQRGH